MPQALGAQNAGSPRRRGIATWRVLGVGQPGCGGFLAHGAEKSGTSRLRMHRTLGIQGAGHAGRGNPEAQGRMPEARSALVVGSRASWARGRTRAVLGTQSPGETARARGRVSFRSPAAGAAFTATAQPRVLGEKRRWGCFAPPASTYPSLREPLAREARKPRWNGG